MEYRLLLLTTGFGLAGCFSDPAATSTTDGDDSSGSDGPGASSTGTGVPPTSEGSSSSGSFDDTTTIGWGTSSSSGWSSSSSSGGAPPAEARDDLYFWVQDAGVMLVSPDGGLLANDDPGADITIASADSQTRLGGTISTEPSGGFTYQPPAALWGHDTFTYTISSAGEESSATVNLWVRPIVASAGDFPDFEAGFSFVGNPGDTVGGDVRSLGDWNGDGFDDLGVVANATNMYAEGSSGSDNEGPAYVLLGGPYSGDSDPSGPESNVGGFAISPTVSSNGDPATIVGGDYNGDGMGDLAITTPFFNLSGRAWVLFGDEGTNSFAIESWDYKSDGYIVGGFGGQLAPLASLGDFNGDGADELAYSGCRVVFGSKSNEGWTGAELPPGLGFTVSGREHCWVEELGDVNGDGRPELLMYAYDEDGPPGAWVLWGGKSQGDTTLAEIGSGKAGYSIVPGPGSGGVLGPWNWVSGGGDVNGDGDGDILINAEDVLVVGFGKASPGMQTGLEFHSGLGGLRINTPGVPAGAARIVGDMNGDGRSDIVITHSGTQRAYVLYGGPAAQRNLPEAGDDGSMGFIIEDLNLGARLRTTSGDFNGDGLADVAIGAQDSQGGAGAVYVIYGAVSYTHLTLP
ncbi:MAG: FG-GAP repeat protein, partial [Nannocystaceae bacterium]|nr:FG-GAP repeat protein [Nannocystaceae bacterium]